MVATRTNGTATTGPYPGIPNDVPDTAGVVSAEHAVEWSLTGPVWQAEVSAAHYTSDHTLRVEARLLRLSPRSDERWELCFVQCVFKLQPAGAPGNEPLTRPEQYTPFASLSSVLYEVKHSEWLPTCQPTGGAPGQLHHFVIDEGGQAWHVAAADCFGRRLDEEEDLGSANQPRLAEASISASERG